MFLSVRILPPFVYFVARHLEWRFLLLAVAVSVFFIAVILRFITKE